MTALPPDIKNLFYKTISGKISINDFERWLYDAKELEAILRPDDYLDLISLNFKKSGAKYELYYLLKKHNDLGEYETFKLLTLLEDAKHKTDKLPFILMDFYNLYCKGYDFLRDLGLAYGLSVEVPPGNYSADTWDELTAQEQKKLLDSFSPRLEEEIQKVIGWLASRKIILTGEENEMGHYKYIDLLTEEDRKSKLWVPIPKDKKWWQFWK